MADRRYRVCGTDDLGDVHAFESDDEDRARYYLETVKEDLGDATLVDRGAVPQA